MQVAGSIIYIILTIFWIFLWIRFVVDWVMVFARDWSPRGPVLVVLEAVYSVTDPPIKALRRVVPPLRLGSIALDLSFLIVFISVWILRSVVAATML
ncbi:YggT family protein [Nocardioides cremeus]|uniref:YggT family protein n=1 Tax=Nocardioides cremeus TaxID=3058044 RepID=A0ABT8TUU9_9ACTN|nr:YggT family protein [Nocardioides cremeus]MDO3397730.1 YggT family protein [Nocardioides cremeus]